MSLGDDGAYGGGEYSEQGRGQTRTRLPGGDGDAYGTGRRPRSGASSRNLVTIVGVVVLLIAAIAFANRGGSGSDAASGDGADGSPAARSTAPTGQRPVSGKSGTIASGFPKTEQGAQSAAANYAVALGSSEMFDQDQRHQILESVIAPSALSHFRTSMDKAYSPTFFKNVGLNKDGTTPEGLTFVSRTVPIGTKAEKVEGNSAKVSVWYSELFGIAGEGSQNPVTESWYTSTLQLRWVDGDWKVESSERSEGPAPVSGDMRASGADEITKAVEGYGGFTYAR